MYMIRGSNLRLDNALPRRQAGGARRLDGVYPVHMPGKARETSTSRQGTHALPPRHGHRRIALRGPSV